MAYQKPTQKETLVQGKVKWACVHVLDQKFTPCWHITIYPTVESLNLIRDLQAEGLKNVIKKDEENQYYVRFTRYPYKEYRSKAGQLKRTEFAAPEVMLRDGTPIKEALGSNSDVTIRLDVYEHNVPGSEKKAKAARLTGVIIDTFIPFISREQQHLMDLAEKTEPVQDPAW